MKKQNLTQEEVSDMLLWGLWRSIHEDYKMKYPRDIWGHFENAIKSASYTSNLKGFLSLFQRRIPLDLQAQYVKDIKKVIDNNQDDEILTWLRTESTYMMMLVRLRNQQRKDDFKEANQEDIIDSKTDFLTLFQNEQNKD
jgi:hypothetical protein